jgi:hypothetical protein
MKSPYDRSGEPLDRVDETLRIIATLPAPVGLTDRVKARLDTASRGANLIAWPRAGADSGWMQGTVLRGAAAAAIVCVVAGGGWRIYSHVQPAPAARAIVLPARVGSSGAFSNAGAKHTPDTLNRPVVPPTAMPAQRSVEVDSHDAGNPGHAATRGKPAGAKSKAAAAPR